MIDWQKLQPLYERKSYRIVQKHISRILNKIPIDNATPSNYELLIKLNISYDDIYKMFTEVYKVIGLNYGNRINKELEKVKKANVLFNETLLKEILLFLQSDGGAKIVSVNNTLIEEVIKSIKNQLGDNATVIELQNAIYNVVSRSQTYFKWQALRIARTETTTSSNFAAMKTAEQSDLVLEKIWISVQDNRTRIKPYDHLDMNNQKQDLEKPFFVGGENIMFPGDAKASPGNTINCRCTVGFVPKRDEEGILIFKK